MLIFCKQGTIICCVIWFSDKGEEKGNSNSMSWIWCGDIMLLILAEIYSLTLLSLPTAALLLPKAPSRLPGGFCFPIFCRTFVSALGRTRTCDLLIRSQTLYPAELRAREVCL